MPLATVTLRPRVSAVACAGAGDVRDEGGHGGAGVEGHRAEESRAGHVGPARAGLQGIELAGHDELAGVVRQRQDLALTQVGLERRVDLVGGIDAELGDLALGHTADAGELAADIELAPDEVQGVGAGCTAGVGQGPLRSLERTGRGVERGQPGHALAVHHGEGAPDVQRAGRRIDLEGEDRAVELRRELRQVGAGGGVDGVEVGLGHAGDSVVVGRRRLGGDRVEVAADVEHVAELLHGVGLLGGARRRRCS